MSGQNKHGLTDYISADVRRSVRRRCGFGCVLCGQAIIQYHHFDPPFEDATENRPEGITLLCGQCHAKFHKGLISLDTITKANGSPYCMTAGRAKDKLFFSCTSPQVWLGSAGIQCQYPIVYHNELILGFDAAAEQGSPLRLQANLTGPDGEKIFEVVDNEWQVGANLFDIEEVANRLVIRNSGRKIILDMTFVPEAGLIIEALDMSVGGSSVVINKQGLMITGPSGGTIEKVGGLLGAVGVYFPHTGGVLLASPAPFLGRQIMEFAPANELEHALAHCRDGDEAWKRFVSVLHQSEVHLVEVSSSSFGFAEYVTVNLPGDSTPHVLLMTSADRARLIPQGAVPYIGLPLSVPFKSLISRFSSRIGVCLNWWSPISLAMGPELVRKSVDGQTVDWPFGGAGMFMP